MGNAPDTIVADLKQPPVKVPVPLRAKLPCGLAPFCAIVTLILMVLPLAVVKSPAQFPDIEVRFTPVIVPWSPVAQPPLMAYAPLRSLVP